MGRENIRTSVLGHFKLKPLRAIQMASGKDVDGGKNLEFRVEVRAGETNLEAIVYYREYFKPQALMRSSRV